MFPRSLRPLFHLLVVQYVVLAELQSPPSIIEGPPPGVKYFSDNVGERVELPCRATGKPDPQYEWTRNGVGIEGSGTLVINEPEKRDEGVYQCFASNGVGKAMSNTTFLLKSVRAYFDQDPAGRLPATIGNSLRVECQPSTPNIPSPDVADFAWRTGDDKTWQLSRRVQIDDNGNLNIAAVTAEDIDEETIWECVISNRINSVDARGSKTKIVSSGQAAGSDTKPEIMFYTNQTKNSGGTSTVVVGLEGQTVSLRCFFSGSAGVSINWARTDGGIIPSDSRIERRDFGVRLAIGQLRRSDEGDYSCTGSNNAGSNAFPVQLLVHAVPTFKSINDRPHDRNGSVGENVDLHCNAYAIPEASVIWFRDGEQLDPDSASSKFLFSSDRKTLTIRTLCKNDCNGQNDLMVIQCNASNTHGYVLANGYINVFERTVFTMTPEDITPNFPDPVTFTVTARSDPDTPITYTWYRKNDDEKSLCKDDWCTVSHVADKTYIANDNGSSLTIYDTEESDLGTYKCVASNGVSQEEFEMRLLVPPGLDKSTIWPLWWVPLLILLLILIVIIIVCCVCCWMLRNRGYEYPVDEKERAADRDPEKELADSGFHDYQRPTRHEDDRHPLTS